MRNVATLDVDYVDVSVLAYRSAALKHLQEDRSAVGGPVLQWSEPAYYAARCLAIGIGRECGDLVAGLGVAPWFSHLRETVTGPRWFTDRAESPVWSDFLQSLPSPHVASIALPARPNWSQVEISRAMGAGLRQQGAFVIVTTACSDPVVLMRLGPVCDCVLRGHGGGEHHTYPARTVIEPASGRLICYDLYDVCSLWAGRVGDFDVVHPAADALHVEIPAADTTLAAIDALAAGLADDLDEPGNLRLFNVVEDACLRKATPTSFSNRPVVQQDRVVRGKLAGHLLTVGRESFSVR